MFSERCTSPSCSIGHDLVSQFSIIFATAFKVLRLDGANAQGGTRKWCRSTKSSPMRNMQTLRIQRVTDGKAHHSKKGRTSHTVHVQLKMFTLDAAKVLESDSTTSRTLPAHIPPLAFLGTCAVLVRSKKNVLSVSTICQKTTSATLFQTRHPVRRELSEASNPLTLFFTPLRWKTLEESMWRGVSTSPGTSDSRAARRIACPQPSSWLPSSARPHGPACCRLPKRPAPWSLLLPVLPTTLR